MPRGRYADPRLVRRRPRGRARGAGDGTLATIRLWRKNVSHRRRGGAQECKQRRNGYGECGTFHRKPLYAMVVEGANVTDEPTSE